MSPRRPVDPVVEELRARLAAVDRALVLGLRARERTQQELFSYKRRIGIGLVDLEQERLVKRRARRVADECGADPDLAEHLVSRAIASGKRRFRTMTVDPRPSASPVVVFVCPTELAVPKGPATVRLAPTIASPPAG